MSHDIDVRRHLLHAAAAAAAAAAATNDVND